MAKRIRSSSVSADSWNTDWLKCCLCQEDTDEGLKATDDGYAMLARNIPKFQELNNLPIPLDIARINNGDGIEATLKLHEAKYHPSCRIKFNNTKLKRAEDKCEATKEPVTSCSSPKFFRRCMEPLDTTVQQASVQCFLCDEEGTETSLRKAMTMNLNERLKKCAETLQDKALLAKLSVGDEVAQDMKYHPACLAALYNRERAVKSKHTLQQAKQSDGDKESEHIALVELVPFIYETQRNNDGSSVFRLADLANMFDRRMGQFSEGSNPIHRTRLKEMLLNKIPDLQAYTKGREVLLLFENDVGPAIALACSYDDTLHIAKTAEVIRAQIKGHNRTTFTGEFYLDNMQAGVPKSLLELVCMIEHGPDIESQLENGVSKADLAIAQLLMYNYHTKQSKKPDQQRHTIERETPICIYIGLLIYAKTRKRQLIDILFQYGLSISYYRVLEISTQLGEAVVERYLSEGIVCPPVLRKGLFTTSAVDNIDHNPSSTTAKSSFHGTGISIFQHPSQNNSGIERTSCTIGNTLTSKQVPLLLDSYTNVRPAFIKTKTSPPCTSNTIVKLPNHEYLGKNLMNEYEWLNEVRLTDKDSVFDKISWPSFHSSNRRGPSVQVSLTSLMPLFPEQAHSVSMIKHSMDKVKEIVNFLNPGQTPVITADQPLFVLAKQIQWEWSNVYGEDKFIIMFGGLHIEMACFKVLGDILRDSGWVDALIEADIATSGIADSFLVCSNVPRTRHAHQFTACALFDLLMSAYEEVNLVNSGDDSVSYEDLMEWSIEREATRPQFRFWRSVLNLELLALSFVRAFRESVQTVYINFNTLLLRS